MDRVIIESPYAGAVKKHTLYARRALFDSLKRGEAPIASHLLHTQVLSENNPDEREWSISAGLAWISVADKMAVYVDYGISRGVRNAIEAAGSFQIPVEYRSIGQNDQPAEVDLDMGSVI